MFAAVAPMQQSSNPSQYPWTPARPSPLSPRRASTTNFATPQPQFQSPTSLFGFTPSPSPSQAKAKSFTEPVNKTILFSSPSRPEPTTTNIFNPATSPTPNPSNTPSNSAYATRYTTQISNPMSRKTLASSTSPRARSVRRNAFLNRVKQDRDNGRTEARAERIAYMEDVAEQKEWDEHMRRRADEIQAGLDPDEFFVNGDDAEIQALDEYIKQERAMEMELLEQVEGGTTTSSRNMHSASFSDDEYDDIFMDLADHAPANDDMDMSG